MYPLTADRNPGVAINSQPLWFGIFAAIQLWLPTFPLGAIALEATPVVPATVVVTPTVVAALRTAGRAVVPATVVATVVATTSACGQEVCCKVLGNIA